MHLPSCSIQVLVAGFDPNLLKASALHQSIHRVRSMHLETEDGCFSAIYFFQNKILEKIESARHAPRQSAHYRATTPFTPPPPISRDPLIILVTWIPSPVVPPGLPAGSPGILPQPPLFAAGPGRGPPPPARRPEVSLWFTCRRWDSTWFWFRLKFGPLRLGNHVGTPYSQMFWHRP